MVKLRKRPSVTLQLDGGVTITSQPIGAADIDLATHAVRRRLGLAADAVEAMQRYGVAAPDIEKGGESFAVALFGVPNSLLAIELGIRHVQSWTGVLTDEEGDRPAPVEAGFIAMLFNEWLPVARAPGKPQNYGGAWLEGMLAHSTLETAGPKGSAASQGTSTAAAANTVEDAGSAEKPAQTEGA